MTADLATLGTRLDALLDEYTGPASDLLLLLDGRADLLRHAAAAPERAVRARRAADLAAQRDVAISAVATACHLFREHVSDILRGDGTSYSSRRAQVLEEAAKHPALADELRALTRAAEARAKAMQRTPEILPPPKPNMQGITINGK